MSNPALQVVEEAYAITLNPEQDYFAQLQTLAQSGELANRISANKVLFKLCELIDLQAKKIKSLEDDRIAIAQKMLELQKANQQSELTDPTKPLG